MTKELLTHKSFSKLMVNEVCVARADNQVDGTVRISIPMSTFNQVVSPDVALNWMTAQCLAVALSN